MKVKELLIALTMSLVSGAAIAGSADVVDVKMTRTGPELYRFDVTVRHPDTGWDHYADKWDVVAPDGRVLGTRTLLHPHVNEQPFTRSLSGVRIPGTVSRVMVRAHDNVDGYGKVTKTITIQAATE